MVGSSPSVNIGMIAEPYKTMPTYAIDCVCDRLHVIVDRRFSAVLQRMVCENNLSLTQTCNSRKFYAFFFPHKSSLS